MSDRINYWKCPKCRGSGRTFPVYAKAPEPCFECDGTGNAMVSGETEHHRRRLVDFDGKASGLHDDR